ncbi:MAG: GIY-YIG nuclease family protein [Candidatus Pacebacteria bacterium]|nr:GIY-YIG nuclease family protein [Candidatus Paceibacterota bacterium]
MAWVYIIKTKLGKYYIGSTSNIEERLKHHMGGHTPTTKRFGFDELVFSQEFSTLSEARKIENKLKKFKRRDFVEKIIQDGYIKIKI